MDPNEGDSATRGNEVVWQTKDMPRHVTSRIVVGWSTMFFLLVRWVCGGIRGDVRGPVTGDDIGAPETGVPGLLPMGLGDFIMGGPVTGEDMGKEVAGLPGLGLAIAPGGIPRGPPGPW